MFSLITVFLIRLYQKTISPDHGFLNFFFRNRVCVFYPTCSEYAIQSIKKYGFRKGLFLSTKRILACHPWQKNRFDPVK